MSLSASLKWSLQRPASYRLPVSLLIVPALIITRAPVEGAFSSSISNQIIIICFKILKEIDEPILGYVMFLLGIINTFLTSPVI